MKMNRSNQTNQDRNLRSYYKKIGKLKARSYIRILEEMKQNSYIRYIRGVKKCVASSEGGGGSMEQNPQCI